MKITHFGLSIACAGALALTQVAGAQTSGGQGQYGQHGAQQGAVKLSKADKDFLKEAAEKSVASMKSAQLAQQKATDPNVKRFAQQQYQTSQNMYNQLNQIAQQHNITLPTQMTSEDRKDYDKLAAVSGSEFDKDYTHWVAEESEKAMEDYQKEADSGQNPAVKSFAATHVSIIKTQTQTAQGLERGVASSATGQMDGSGQQQSDQDQP